MKEFFRQLSELIRNSFLIVLVLAAASLGIWRLMMLQIVGADDTEVVRPANQAVYGQVIPAARGEIVDTAGKPIISNTIGYHVIVEKAYFPADAAEGNAVLLETARMLQEAGCTVSDTMPVSRTMPYVFEAGRESDVASMREILHLNSYATAENCVDKLISDYAISADYSAEEQRLIAGIRYEMLLRSFSMSNVFYLSRDVSIGTVARIKELRVKLRGINIVEEAIRDVVSGNVLPHEIGYIGPIYSREEFERLKENGHSDYALSDQVGKTGLEQALESELRGTNGRREITVTNGDVSSVRVAAEPVGGKTVQLTVNSEFQTGLQAILSEYTAHLRATDSECRKANCGAFVVLDAKDNAVRGMATLPTYDLSELLEDYSAVAERADTPLVNRATDGLYRPGSTFKTITATAGLNTGVVTKNTSFYCGRNYKFIDQTVHCTGEHHSIAVSQALTVSCNIYFYELAQRLGLDRLLEYENKFGLGSPLGLESGDSGGYLACPETYEKLGIPWYIGNLLQAAIGQSEVQVTPLQMATVASTVANKGVRYQPHLVEAYWDHGMNERLSVTEPVVAETIEQHYDGVFDTVKQGMIGAAKTQMPAQYDLNRIGFQTAIKTGTPQSPRGTDSFVIGFAPADDPEIAFCAMIEGGKNAKYMVRDMLELYAKCYPESRIGKAVN
ncbi:MAG: hypothetical protein J6Z45_06725 [Oscillospiraceae bacterium]|nr:hypothetical protein [Oscillospiraceae bacterium]